MLLKNTKTVCLDQITVKYLPTNNLEDIVKVRTQWWNTTSEGEDHRAQEKQMRALSTHAWAQLVVQNDKISFDTRLHILMQGTLRSYQSSNLVPVTILQLLIHRQCYHILAAKVIMGMSVSNKHQEGTWLNSGGTQVCLSWYTTYISLSYEHFLSYGHSLVPCCPNKRGFLVKSTFTAINCVSVRTQSHTLRQLTFC